MGSQMRMVWPKPTGRRPQDENKVTFYKSKEFKLRDFVSERSVNSERPCLFEMSQLLTCLKDNKFNDQLCSDETKEFHSCYLKALGSFRALKERKKNPGKYFQGDNMLSVEVNDLLKKYSKTMH